MEATQSFPRGRLHPVIGLAQSWFWEEVEEEAEGAGDVSREGHGGPQQLGDPCTFSLSCLSLLGSENRVIRGLLVISLITV